ncbi:MAG: hypothetical protein ACYDBQ_07645 [Thermoplasmatota archaeon]
MRPLWWCVALVAALAPAAAQAPALPTLLPTPAAAVPANHTLPPLPLHVALPGKAAAPAPTGEQSPAMLWGAPAVEAASATWLVALTAHMNGGFEALRARVARNRFTWGSSPAPWGARRDLRTLRRLHLMTRVQEEVANHPGATLPWLAGDLKEPERRLRPIVRRLVRLARLRRGPHRTFFPGR